MIAKRIREFPHLIDIYKNPSAQKRKDILWYFCYSNWVKATHINLEPGEAVEFEVKVIRRIK